MDVVNLTVGKMGISVSDFRWATQPEGVRHLVPFPGALRVPDFRAEPCPVLYTLKHFYYHVLFGFVLDMLARMAGVKPR